MTRLERKAALAVAAATAGVIVSGVSLIKKHTKYLAEKAAATFSPDDEDEELTKEALAAADGADEENSPEERCPEENHPEEIHQEENSPEAGCQEENLPKENHSEEIRAKEEAE